MLSFSNKAGYRHEMKVHEFESSTQNKTEKKKKSLKKIIVTKI